MTTEKDKTKKPADKRRRPAKSPRPAPEGRQRPHHDGHAVDPLAQKEYRTHDRGCFDPHQSEASSVAD